MLLTTLTMLNLRTCMKFGKHNDILKDKLIEISDNHKDKEYFLDIGCGDCSKTLLFNNYGRYLHGIDCMDWRIKKAKNKVEFLKADIMDKMPPMIADIIFSFDVIEHLPNPEKLLQFAKKSLCKDGVLVVGTPNRVRMGTLGLRKFPYNPDNHDDKYAAHLREYTTKELTELLSCNGFYVKKVHKLFYGITGSYGFSELFGLPLYHHIILEAVHVSNKTKSI